MGGAVGWFSVTSTIRSGNGTNVPFAFRVAEADSLEAFSDILTRDGCITGDRFRVQNGRSEHQARLIDKRRTLLTAEGIASVTEFSGIEDFAIYE